MLKKTINYVDYNDNTRTEDFYFNLTQAEVMEMELSTTGGLSQTLERIIAAQDTPELIRIFKDLILRAYGEKSSDGRQFMKSPERAKAFSETPAYSALFMELALDADAAAKFVNGIVPNMPQSDAQKFMEAKVNGQLN